MGILRNTWDRGLRIAQLHKFVGDKARKVSIPWR
jgi:hypothetical protein